MNNLKNGKSSALVYAFIPVQMWRLSVYAFFIATVEVLLCKTLKPVTDPIKMNK